MFEFVFLKERVQMEFAYLISLLRILFVISVPVTLTVYACMAVGASAEEMSPQEPHKL